MHAPVSYQRPNDVQIGWRGKHLNMKKSVASCTDETLRLISLALKGNK